MKTNWYILEIQNKSLLATQVDARLAASEHLQGRSVLLGSLWDVQRLADENGLIVNLLRPPHQLEVIDVQPSAWEQNQRLGESASRGSSGRHWPSSTFLPAGQSSKSASPAHNRNPVALPSASIA